MKKKISNQIHSHLPDPFKDPDFAAKAITFQNGLIDEYKRLNQAIPNKDSRKLSELRLKLQESFQKSDQELKLYYIKLNDEIVKEYAKKGIDLIKNVFEPMKKDLQKYIQNNPAFRSKIMLYERHEPKPISELFKDDIHSQASRDATYVKPPESRLKTLSSQEIKLQISEIEIGNAGIADRMNDLLMYALADTCSDSEVNAFYHSEKDHSSIVICPEMLIRALVADKGTSMSYALFHEVTHSFDSNKSYVDFQANLSVLTPQKQADTKGVDLDRKYDSFLNCVSKNRLGNLGYYFKMPKYVQEEILPFLNKKIDDLNKQNPSMTRDARLKKYEEFKVKFDGVVKICHSNDPDLAEMKEKVCHSKERINRFDRELVADQVAYEASVAKMKLFTPEERLKKIKLELHDYCETEANEQFSLDLKHPPNKVRIEQFLFHPEMRKLMGCPVALPDKTPYCSIGMKQ